MAKDVAIKFTINDKCTPAIIKISKAFGASEASVKRAQKSFNTAIKTLNKQVDVFKNNALKLGAMGVVAGGAILTLGKNCVQAASDMQETQSKVNEVFKTNAKDIENWAKTSITSMGLSRQSAMDTAALFGDMATGMNLSTDKAAKMSSSLTQLSADLASFKNISQERAKTALNGVFTGETEALKGLGIVMTQANLEEFAHQKGISKKIKDMKEAEKVMLRYEYVMSKTSNAQGDFARTGGGYANQSRIFVELQKEYAERIGTIFLPKINDSMKKINDNLSSQMPNIVKSVAPIFDKTADIIGFFVDNLDSIVKIAPVVIGSILAFQTVTTVASAFTVLSTAVGVLNGVMNLSRIIFLTHPIGMAIVAVGLLITLVAVLAKNWDKVTSACKKAGEFMKIVFGSKDEKTKVAAKIPQYASGTSFASGGLSLVGEEGPELVDLKQGSRVTNAKDTQKALNNKNITINLNIAGNVIGNHQFINQIKQVLGRELATVMAV